MFDDYDDSPVPPVSREDLELLEHWNGMSFEQIFSKLVRLSNAMGTKPENISMAAMSTSLALAVSAIAKLGGLRVGVDGFEKDGRSIHDFARARRAAKPENLS